MTIPLDLMNLREDENHQVVIIGDDATGRFLESKKGIRLTEFAVGGANEFQSLFELASQQTLQNALNMGKGLFDTATGMLGIDAKFPDIRLKRLAQTKLTWITSATPVFVVQILFVALRPEDDVRKDVMDLQRAVFPDIDENGVIKPPLGADNNNGEYWIKLGKWFQAPSQVIRKAEFVFSKELTSPGNTTSFPSPLYAVGAVTFSPRLMPSADVVQSYFPEV
jgi:hypothetical protein